MESSEIYFGLAIVGYILICNCVAHSRKLFHFRALVHFSRG